MEKVKTGNRRKRLTAIRLKRSIPLYILMLPSVILLICFTYKPMYGVVMAFQDFVPTEGIWGSKWVGLKHFNQYFNSYKFSQTLKNTLVLSFYGLLVGFPLPIALALLCNQIRRQRFKKVFQVITYLPHFISTMVMCGLLLIFLSPSTSIFANMLELIGVKMPNLMSSQGAFSSIYVWSDVWQHVGWDSIIYLAALSAIDPTYYEAATVDGAGRFQKILYIDLPMILPTTMILLILRAGSILSVGFEKVFLLQNSLNIGASEIISTYVYKVGMINYQYSLSAAVNLFNTVVNFAVLLLVNGISKRLTKLSLL